MDSQVTVIERNASMIEAMKTEQDEFSARDLHEFLQVETRFNDWFKRRLKNNDFRENIDYRAITQKRVTAQGNVTEQTEYILTLDMAKHLALMEQNDQGQQFRNYFILAEKKAKELSKPKRIAPFTLAPVTDYVLYNGHKLDVIEYDGSQWFYQTALLKALNTTNRRAKTFETYGNSAKYGTRRIILIDSLQRIADSPSQSKEVVNLRLFLRDMQPDGTQVIETQRNSDTDKLLKLAKIAKKDGLKGVYSDLINRALDTV